MTEFEGDLRGTFTGTIGLPDVGNGNGDTVSGITDPFDTPVLWKANGGGGHPDIRNGILRARAQKISAKVVEIQIYLEPGSTTQFGGLTTFWYFQPVDLMADLELGHAAGFAVGPAFAWYGGNDNQREGCCWWGKPGGILKYGIRVTLAGRDFRGNEPGQFGEGDKMRLSMRYELP